MIRSKGVAVFEHEMRLEQQIFRRIAGQCQFGKRDNGARLRVPAQRSRERGRRSRLDRLPLD